MQVKVKFLWTFYRLSLVERPDSKEGDRFVFIDSNCSRWKSRADAKKCKILQETTILLKRKAKGAQEFANLTLSLSRCGQNDQFRVKSVPV
jgi:hypothetical protein